jgi:hypothetical protein
VAGLDGEDGSGGSEVGLAHDVGGSTEVGRDTNALEDGGGSEEALDIGDTKAVSALGDGCDTSS